MISGEPGIGKTRLADELYQSCVRQGHAAARSRCYAGQGQVAYAPVAEWLRSDAIRAGWTNLGPQQLVELARLVPEIREQFPEAEPLQPSPLAESWQRLHFYESLSAAFGKSRKPLLLYLDDMQWCDPESFEWLNALLTSLAAAGVLVVGTVRAEETGREHPFTRFLAGMRQSGIVLEIPLEPLDAEETGELARLESAETAGKRESGRDLPGHAGQSAVRGGERTRRIAEHAGARRDRGAPGTAYGELLTNWPAWRALSGGPSPSNCSRRLRIGTKPAFPRRSTNSGGGVSSKAAEHPSTISRTTACAKWPARN